MKKTSLLLAILLFVIPMVKITNATSIREVRKEEELKWGDYFIRPQMNHRELVELERFTYELMVSMEKMDSRRAMQMYDDTYLIRVVAGAIFGGVTAKVLTIIDTVVWLIDKFDNYEVRLLLKEVTRGHSAVRHALYLYENFERTYRDMIMAEIEFAVFDRTINVNGEHITNTYIAAGGNIKRIKTRTGWITPGNTGEYYNKKENIKIDERH